MEPTTKENLQVAQDLLDTLITHKDTCAGMAANMIGVRTVNKNTGLHNPYSPLLFGEVMPEDKIIERKMVSLKNNQLNLF